MACAEDQPNFAEFSSLLEFASMEKSRAETLAQLAGDTAYFKWTDGSLAGDVTALAGTKQDSQSTADEVEAFAASRAT